MQERTLGRSGPDVSALGSGCMEMSFGYGPVYRQERMSLMSITHRAFLPFCFLLLCAALVKRVNRTKCGLSEKS